MLSIALVALGCGHTCPPPPVSVRPAPTVVPGPPHCLTRPPPAMPPAVESLAAADAPPTPEQLDQLEWWAGALADYAWRAWQQCGAAPTVSPESPRAGSDAGTSRGQTGATP